MPEGIFSYYNMYNNFKVYYKNSSIKICDRSRENVAYAEIINSWENAILSKLQKFADFYFLLYLQSRTITTPDYALDNTRLTLISEILVGISYSLVSEWR